MLYISLFHLSQYAFVLTVLFITMPASLLQINTDCPDFDSVFDSTENKATLVCNSLTVRLDQIGMCYFKKFLEDLQNRYVRSYMVKIQTVMLSQCSLVFALRRFTKVKSVVT